MMDEKEQLINAVSQKMNLSPEDSLKTEESFVDGII